MNIIKKYLTYLLTGMVIISLSGCDSPSNNQQVTPPPVSPAPIDIPKIPESEQTELNSNREPDNNQEQEKAIPSTPLTPIASQPLNTTETKTTTVNIYHVDNQCTNLVPEKVTVPVDNSLEAAIGKVLEKANSGDLNLAGYRVNIDPKSGMATVDLRLSPDSPRLFISLSSCERLALFGSLRKTLMDNSQWKVKDVSFTEQGKEMLF